MVTTLNDSFDSADNEWSLREAIYWMMEYTNITFAKNLSGTIILTLGQLNIDRELTINGDNRIILDANKRSRVFHVNTGTKNAPIVLQALTIQNGAADRGGGIYNGSDTLILTNCTIFGNSSTDRDNGGGIYNNSGSLTLTNCTISENSASYNGGGFYKNSGSLTLTNCTISENSASYGGGFYNNSGTLTLYNSIVACNTALYSGNDIYKNVGSINAYNTLSSYTAWTSSSSCYVYDSTRPLFTDTANGDYTLTPASQAIDKGNNTYVVDAEGNPILYDLAGHTRIINNIVDLGAYEYQSLNAPSNVRFDDYNPTAKTVKMSWNDNSSDEKGFYIEYSTNNGATWNRSQYMKANETSRTCTGLISNRDYMFRVRAYNDSGSSDWAIGSFSTKFAPVAPSNVTFESYNAIDKTVVMFWTDNSNNEKGFRIEYSINNGKTWQLSQFKKANETSRTCTGLTANKDYMFRVRAYNDSGSSDWAVGTFSTKFAPAAPTDVLFSNYNAITKTVVMSWTDNSNNEKGFRVEYSTDNGATWRISQFMKANETSRTCSGIKSNTTYMFRVRAYNDTESSDWAVATFVPATTSALHSSRLFDSIFEDEDWI